jgi:hypothetical protein
MLRWLDAVLKKMENLRFRFLFLNNYALLENKVRIVYYLLLRPFKKIKWVVNANGKACGLIFQNGGSHKPNYM